MKHDLGEKYYSLRTFFRVKMIISLKIVPFNNIRMSDFGIESVKEICQGIRYLPNLEFLSLNFRYIPKTRLSSIKIESECKIGDHGAIEIAQILPYLKHLEKLDL